MMKSIKRIFLPILITGIWINIVETIIWVILVKAYWLERYEELQLTFPNETANNIAWMVWGFLFASLIFLLSRKYNLIQTTFLAWIPTFPMMWIVVWNAGVLPMGMLWFNMPLSLLVAFSGAFICKRFFKN